MNAQNVVTLPPKDRQREIERVVALCERYQLGKPVNVRLTIARPERTPPQLRYLWGCAYELLSEAAGYEKQDIHEWLCLNFYGKKIKKLPDRQKVADVPQVMAAEHAPEVR